MNFEKIPAPDGLGPALYRKLPKPFLGTNDISGLSEKCSGLIDLHQQFGGPAHLSRLCQHFRDDLGCFGAPSHVPQDFDQRDQVLEELREFRL